MKKMLRIQGMDCAGCSAKVEAALKGIKQVKSTNVNFATGKALVELTEKVDDFVFESAIKKSGYKLSKETTDEQSASRIKKELSELKKKVMFTVSLAIPLAYLSMGETIGLFVPQMDGMSKAIIQLILSSSIIALCWNIYVKGFRTVIISKSATMETLVALGTGAAYLYSVVLTILMISGKNIKSHEQYFEIAGILLTFILIGKLMEGIAKGRASDSIKKLLQLSPKKAIVIRNGKKMNVQINEVKVGDLVLVKPGQKIPVDGNVTEGQTYVDESMITGESIPDEKTKGSKVIGGTINKNGTITFRAAKVGNETMLAQIVKLVEEAQSSKAPIQKLADKISSWFVPVVLVIALICAAGWLIAGYGLSFSITILIAVLIIACPCAMGLATPTAIMVGSGMGAQKGILFKNAQSLQELGNAKIIVFDKTGTLTRGKPQVTDIIEFGISKPEVLRIAAFAESRSEHFLADAIIEEAQKKNQIGKLSRFKAIPGRGVEGFLRGKRVTVGNKKLMAQKRIKILDEKIADELENQGKTAVFVAKGNKIIGIIAISDTIKPEAAKVISELHKMGKQTVMITGDNKRTAEAIAKQAGIKRVIAEVLPSDKEKEIMRLKMGGNKVVMVGDGINDAPALAAAEIGVAMGSGTDVAIESGDVVLMTSNLESLTKAIRLSNYTLKKIKQNLFWAFFYNAAGIPIAAGLLYPINGFLLSPLIAGGAMAMSSVSVLANTLWMRRFKL